MQALEKTQAIFKSTNEKNMSNTDQHSGNTNEGKVYRTNHFNVKGLKTSSVMMKRMVIHSEEGDLWTWCKATNRWVYEKRRVGRAKRHYLSIQPSSHDPKAQ